MIYIPQTVVEACDTNNDGFIDFEEFKNLIKEAESAYVRTLFKTYDLNLDGYITQVKIYFLHKPSAEIFEWTVTLKIDFLLLEILN